MILWWRIVQVPDDFFKQFSCINTNDCVNEIKRLFFVPEGQLQPHLVSGVPDSVAENGFPVAVLPLLLPVKLPLFPFLPDENFQPHCQ